jgi:hypothetical protein
MRAQFASTNSQITTPGSFLGTAPNLPKELGEFVEARKQEEHVVWGHLDPNV